MDGGSTGTLSARKNGGLQLSVRATRDGFLIDTSLPDQAQLEDPEAAAALAASIFQTTDLMANHILHSSVSRISVELRNAQAVIVAPRAEDMVEMVVLEAGGSAEPATVVETASARAAEATPATVDASVHVVEPPAPTTRVRRVTLIGVEVKSGERFLTTTVHLAWGVQHATGRMVGRVADPQPPLVAAATAQAMTDLLPPGCFVKVDEVKTVARDGDSPLIVAVSLVTPSSTERLLGIALTRADVNQAAAKAVLNATNSRVPALLATTQEPSVQPAEMEARHP